MLGPMLGAVRRGVVLVSALLVCSALLAAWTLTAVFAQAPSPSSSGSPLPGDPEKGRQLFTSAGCTSCHGANLEGGVGPRLNPIVKLPDTNNPLDPTYLIDTITNGKSGVGGFGPMPPKGGNPSLTDQDVRDLAAFIIQENRTPPGQRALGPVELARSNVFWITVAIFLLVIATWLLARYNMRWVARRAAERREREREG